MTTARVLSRWWIFAAATAMTLFSAALVYNISPPYTPGAAPLPRLVVLNAVYWYLWALFAPLIGWLAVTFRLEKARWKTSVPVHLVAVLFFATAHITLVNGYQYLTRMKPWAVSFATALRRAVIQNIDWEMMTYWVIVGVTHAVLYYRESQQRTLKAAQLEAKLAASQLQNLQAQLQPHFFFNTLHAISALMHRDVGAADRMLTRLSDLLRLSLERVGLSEVPLKDEIEFLEKYVEIECTRYQDRLAVYFDVAPETLDAMVPNLLLQPIVENAIRHGIAPRSGPGRVDVIARHEGDRLWLEVRDDGLGLTEDALIALQKGLGVSTTRARLEHQYGPHFRFEFLRLPAGLSVRVVIPWRTSPIPIGELLTADS